eukprot:SAG31_NODE_35630_length_321_cov_0.900901_1_plen_35_part_10
MYQIAVRDSAPLEAAAASRGLRWCGGTWASTGVAP